MTQKGKSKKSSRAKESQAPYTGSRAPVTKAGRTAAASRRGRKPFRLHLAVPASAAQIREALGITDKDMQAALKALDLK